MAKTQYISPFAPKALPDVPTVQGVRFATAEAGIRYQNRTDLMVTTLSEGTVVAGVTTKSKTCSAPVLWCREGLKTGRARALVVNSGNANAFTGRRGDEAAALTAEAAAQALDCPTSEIFLASTGVIGEPMDAGRFTDLIAKMIGQTSPSAWHQAASAIMTTDTFPKLTSRQIELDGTTVTIAGFSKGAGMIAPDMATMLAFIFTDAAIDQTALQNLVSDINARTFNCITIDGDTSTSDTVLVFATGQSGAQITANAAPQHQAFAEALEAVMHDLAMQIVKDGEGLTKFVEISVTGAEHDAAARTIALAIANSPLVKTAFAGEDPNWGRIIMAIGKSGEAADRDRLKIEIGPHLVATNGERAAGYDEATVAAYMKNAELKISVDVGVGQSQATVWTCDLTHDYISINADYRS